MGAALLAEFVPRRPRGALLGSIQALWIVGFVAAFLIGSAVSPDAWRWLLASSAVPAFVVLVLRTGLPESPRWLHAQGRTAEAEQIVHDRIGDYAIPDVAPAAARAGLANCSPRPLAAVAVRGPVLVLPGRPVLRHLHLRRADPGDARRARRGSPVTC